MNARTVHAVLAAGVQSPHRISQWRKNPQFLRDRGIDPEAMDLEALWKFAGLTLKVRHNGVRQILPLTFRLMDLAGIEIEVFASYAAFCGSKERRLADGIEGRAHGLLVFLEHWLDPGSTSHILLWDMIRHELALDRLARIPALASPVPRSPRKRRSGTGVATICGTVILHEMQSSPRVVEAALFRRPHGLREVAVSPHYYCYWRRFRPEIQILELDAFGYHALGLIDGARSVAELSYLMGSGRRPKASFLRSLRQLAAIGVIGFAPAAGGRREVTAGG